MTLSKGNIIKLISADQAKVVLSDWLNSREAAPGDIALVEEVSIAEDGRFVRLLCENPPGFLEWRTCFYEAGLTYELLLDRTDIAS
ncbi:hypothetical protein JFU37_07430 [Pseudomonas sp. TH41]|uniref:hypothetical protein n=1 Tax=Pseudomonas sp. TH41 TaxID=2796405 RepID=UPI0019133536|nr:hypothetical protein [Pseudomonas sp. TH41]MBK5352338.1 hypothetical protein [Pseudomonas sp. TH41]